MPKCTIQDKEFIQIINSICIKEANGLVPFTPLETINDDLIEAGIDSLSIMMVYLWITEGFGISEEDAENIPTGNRITSKDLIGFIKKYQTKGYTTLELGDTFKRYES